MLTRRIGLSLACVALSLYGAGVVAASAVEEGVAELAQEISKSLSAQHVNKVAVVEFINLDGSVNAFGQFLAEELITQLLIANPSQFEIVERRQLMKVLDEQGLSVSGLLEESTSIQGVGKILGVEAILTGSVTDLGQDVKINARVIGVPSARIFAAASANVPKVGFVENLLNTPGKNEQRFDSPSVTPPPFTPNGTVAKDGPLDSRPSSAVQVYVEGFKFETTGCKNDRASIVCTVVITNTKEDRMLRLYGGRVVGGIRFGQPSRIIDHNGKEYLVNEVFLGTSSGSRINSLLVSDVPMQARLIFESIPVGIQAIRLLEISCASGHATFTAQLRNVPLLR